MTDILFFNGVNGATGQYGLQPMSAEALADRVLSGRYHATRQRQELQRSLIDRTLNEQKVLDIVVCLVEDILSLLDGASGEDRDWATGAADRVLSILLGPYAAPSPEDRAFLTDRLAKQPVETLVRIVNLLQSGQGFALTQWLFDRQDRTSAVLRDSLTAKFGRAVSSIRLAYLIPNRGERLASGDTLRPEWIGGLTRALDRLPMDSLQALPGTDALVDTVQRLAKGLEVVYSAREVEPAMPMTVARRFAALRSLGDRASWHGIVANLRELLLALQRSGIPVHAQAVQAVIGTWLDEIYQRIAAPLGVVPWVDPADLSQAGWGVIFPAALPAKEQAAIEAALSPLLRLRARQAGAHYRCYAGAEGYRPGDTARDFLRRPPRHAVAANPAAPEETGVPYYLLLVGSPEQIPFEFQYQLDVQYAVGRLDFGRDLAAYRCYAHNVVAAESGGGGRNRRQPQRRQVVFFGTQHPGDAATALSARHLVAPLGESVRSRVSDQAWHVLTVAPEKASKENLLKLLQLDPPPALVFTATHGLVFEAGHSDQVARQGALLCQDWDGTAGEVSPNACFGAQDVTAELNLRGTILFMFACFGAGTPHLDEYHRVAFQEEAAEIAESPFIAALPKALLALRDRGALAVIGHVERVWGLSFLSDVPFRPEAMVGRKQEHIEVFAAVLEQLLAGQPAGAALDFLNMRYAALATELTTLYDRLGDPPASEDVYRLAELWTASHDARGYVLLGDPAVRLDAGSASEKA
ncbi:MAG: hypothetical protein JXC32_07400 [Anaerolineae bacterium]|nr:hypothetical protein [Anaerolineae bacterium]